MTDRPTRREQIVLRVICPTCDEDIGLKDSDELILPAKHLERLAWFKCHNCRDCWEVTTQITPHEDPCP